MHRANLAIARSLVLRRLVIVLLASLDVLHIARVFASVTLSLLVIIPVAFAQPVINEVMPNPSSSAYDEWVEVYNNESLELNLSDWKIEVSNGTSGTSTSITCNNIANCSLITNEMYFVIIGKKANITRITSGGIAYYNASNVSNYWLSNDGRIITLYNQTVATSNLTYPNFGSHQGESWAFLENVTFGFCAYPTPGSANNCTAQGGNESNVSVQNIVLTVYLTSPVIVGVTYDDLFKIEIDDKDNCSMKDNVSVFYNITYDNGTLFLSGNFTKEVGCSGYANTGEWTPNVSGNFTLCGIITNSTVNETDFSDNGACANITVLDTSSVPCDLEMSIDASLGIIGGQPILLNQSNSTSLSYDLVINDSACSDAEHPLLLTYWIEDLYGDYGRASTNTSTAITCTETLSRSWTPDDLEGSEAFVIRANITNAYCNDSDLSDNYAEKIFVIAGNGNSGSDADSRVSITSINQGNDDTNKWGEVFDVWLEIYRGDTKKYAIDIYVNGTSSTDSKVSQETTVHAIEKFTTYKLKVPVQLKPNCDGDWPNGRYKLAVSGLDTVAITNVSISGISSITCGTASCGSGGGGGGCTGTSTNTTVNTGETSNFYFVSAPDEVGVGEAFDVVVHIQNSASSSATYTVYSYVFDGGSLLSEGLNNDTWQKGWDANTRTITVPAGSGENITLVNRIKYDTPPGSYTLRVRIKDVVDLTKSIEIVVNKTNTLEDENYTGTNNASDQTEGNESMTDSPPPTGARYNVGNQSGRTTITREDIFELIRREASETVQSLATSLSQISIYFSNRTTGYSILSMQEYPSRFLESFISAIAQILCSK